MLCCTNCSCKAPKITFRLEKWERALIFQVLYMDERFRNARNGFSKTFTSRIGFQIRSVIGPEFTREDTPGGAVSGWIDLWGYQSEDDLRVRTIHFASNAERDAYYASAFLALRDWAHKWPGFQDSSCADTAAQPSDGSVFTF
jgi:hypothetical protein